MNEYPDVTIHTGPLPDAWKLAIETVNMPNPGNLLDEAEIAHRAAKVMANLESTEFKIRDDGTLHAFFPNLPGGSSNAPVRSILAFLRKEKVGYHVFDSGDLEHSPHVWFWHAGMGEDKMLFTTEDGVPYVQLDELTAILAENPTAAQRIEEAYHINDYKEAVQDRSLGLA